MNNKELQVIKKEIIHYLCDEFKGNEQPLFDRERGFQNYNGTDLTMVMDKVVKGLKSAQEKIREKNDIIDTMQEIQTIINEELAKRELGVSSGEIENRIKHRAKDIEKFKGGSTSKITAEWLETAIRESIRYGVYKEDDI